MTFCVDHERADVCKSESPLKLRFQQSSFFQENVILGSDYPFPLGEHHPGKLIEDVYKDDLELRVREQSHSVSRCFFFFFFAIDKTPPSTLLKLSIVVIQKFCYHGNVTSHFSLL